MKREESSRGNDPRDRDGLSRRERRAGGTSARAHARTSVMPSRESIFIGEREYKTAVY